MAAERGRPQKYGEPVQKRQFNFPESLSKKLNQLAAARGEDVTKVLHDALRREIESPMSSTNAHIAANEIKQAVHEAMLAATAKNMVCIKLDPQEQAEVQAKATEFGMSDLPNFLRQVACAVTDHSEQEIRQFLVGKSLREIEAGTFVEVESKENGGTEPARKRKRA